MSVEREQYFNIATAKQVFLHAKHGIVFPVDPLPLSEAGMYGLTPLIVYGLTMPGVPGCHLRFAPLDQPQPISNVLADIWNSVPMLRGMPNKLRISRALAEADDGFVQKLLSQGMAVTLSGTKDKSHSGALRSCQKDAWELSFWGRKESLLSVDDLNRFSSRPRDREYLLRTPAQREVAKAWEAFHFATPLALHVDQLDWKPGSWLNSWESNAVRGIQRSHVVEDHLLRSLAGAQEELEDIGLDEFAFKTLCSLIHCWPGGQKSVAAAIGVTVKDIQWMISGKAELPDGKLSKLLALVGMGIDDRNGYMEAEGPCVLIAETPLHAIACYDSLNHGGDLIFSIDAVPDKGMPDPSWHYLCYMSYDYGLNVLMIPRGSKLTAAMARNFLNFNGTQKIPAAIYRDVVATCAAICRDPESNIDAMSDLSSRHVEFFESIENVFPIEPRR